MENSDLIREALSYALGSDLHEAWRAPRKLDDGTFEPRMKKSKDEEWNKIHGTDEVDIANCAFEDLPSNWQYENLEAAKVAINLVFDKAMSGEKLTEEEIEEKAAIIHDEWLKRNDWVFDPNYGDPNLAVPYEKLSEEEKEKDRVQLEPAIRKIQDYKDGLVDIDDICFKYHLDAESKTM